MLARLALVTVLTVLASALMTGTTAAGSDLDSAAAAGTALTGTAPASAALLDKPYPITATISFPASMLHWLDSLAGLEGPGMTGGKTIEVIRVQYERRIGPLSGTDAHLLQQFAQARRSAARSGAKQVPPDVDAVTLLFFQAASLEAALSQLEQQARSDVHEAIAAAFRGFEGRYRQIWNDGKIPGEFLAQARRSELARPLTEYLLQVAAFYDAPPRQRPWPQVHLMPVPAGGGTHAQAIEHHLLMEVRPGDDLLTEVGPLVHENAHLLFARMSPKRKQALEATVRQLGSEAVLTWRLLHEALPTALAQGVAAQRFDPRWSLGLPWYHRQDVDVAAKRIFPLVRDALDEGTVFDEAFLHELLATLRSP